MHINNICQRNYVQVTSGRRLVPTTLGIVLVHGYQKVCFEYGIAKLIKTALTNYGLKYGSGKDHFYRFERNIPIDMR